MTEIDAKALQQRWIHSHEEDAPGLMVFRPAGWQFPPSRGRKSFELRPGGDLVATAPGPTDRTGSANGRWNLRSDGVIELDEPGQRSELRIVDAAADKLVVER
ncbi:MAG: hypothetical protein ABW360_00735 [Phenylobacterium sp.]